MDLSDQPHTPSHQLIGHGFALSNSLPAKPEAPQLQKMAELIPPHELRAENILLCERYWDYSHAEFDSLLNRVKTLPRELREKIYEGLTAWSPLQRYHTTSSLKRAPVSIARRNKVPTFHENELWKAYYRGRVQRLGPVTAETQRTHELAQRGANSPLYFDFNVADTATSDIPANVTMIIIPNSIFQLFTFQSIRGSNLCEACGLLDYYKEVEHICLIDLADELKAYEMRSQSQASSSSPRLNILHEFTDHFWRLNVMDLGATWYKQNNATLSWIDSNPQYHTTIRHISLEIDIEQLPGPEGDLGSDQTPIAAASEELASSLDQACRRLASLFTNLKTIILFVSFQKAGTWDDSNGQTKFIEGESKDEHVLDNQNSLEWVQSLRLLAAPASVSLEVRLGESKMVEKGDRAKERNKRLLRNERAWEMMLKPSTSSDES